MSPVALIWKGLNRHRLDVFHGFENVYQRIDIHTYHLDIFEIPPFIVSKVKHFTPFLHKHMRVNRHPSHKPQRNQGYAPSKLIALSLSYPPKFLEVDVDLADLKLGWICENAVGRVSKGGIYPLANSTASLFLQAISGACTLGIIDDPVRWPNLGPRDDENDLKRSFLFEYMYVPVWELTTIKNIPPFQTKVGFKSSLTQKVPRLFGCKRIFWFVSRV